MKKMLKNLVALLGVSLLGIVTANATISLDCGDDDVQPIVIQSAVTTINEDT